MMKIIEPLLGASPTEISEEELARMGSDPMHALLELVLGKVGASAAFETNIESDLAYMEDLNAELDKLEIPGISPPITPDKADASPSQKFANMWSGIQMAWTPFGRVPIPNFATLEKFSDWGGMQKDVLGLFDNNGAEAIELTKLISKQSINGFWHAELAYTGLKEGKKLLDFTDQQERRDLYGDLDSAQVDVAGRILIIGRKTNRISTMDSTKIMQHPRIY